MKLCANCPTSPRTRSSPRNQRNAIPSACHRARGPHPRIHRSRRDLRRLPVRPRHRQPQTLPQPRACGISRRRGRHDLGSRHRATLARNRLCKAMSSSRKAPPGSTLEAVPVKKFRAEKPELKEAKKFVRRWPLLLERGYVFLESGDTKSSTGKSRLHLPKTATLIS